MLFEPLPLDGVVGVGEDVGNVPPSFCEHRDVFWISRSGSLCGPLRERAAGAAKTDDLLAPPSAARFSAMRFFRAANVCRESNV
jgi:hypothetical protein